MQKHPEVAGSSRASALGGGNWQER